MNKEELGDKMNHKHKTTEGEYSKIISYGDIDKAEVEIRGALMSENLRDVSLNSQVQRFYKKFPNWDKQREQYMEGIKHG